MAQLGSLERKVMDVLWATLEAELTVREIAEQIPERAYTTVLTVLDRLHHKDMVRRVTDARAHRYAAAASRESYIAELMNEALGAAADRNAVLVRFAGTVTPTEAAVLRRALGARNGADAAPGRTPTEGSA